MTQVSYIVTVDNQLPYLEAMLASLRAQEGDHSREYVFVDDGSEDGSFDALIQRTRMWPRTLLIQQRRQGPTAAALAGAKAATGDAWIFLDADVVLNPAATRIGHEALRSGAAERILFPHGIAPAPLSYDFEMPPTAPEVRVADDPLLALLTEFPAPHRRMMMRRSVFRDPGLFDPGVYLPDVAPPLNAALTHTVGELDLDALLAALRVEAGRILEAVVPRQERARLLEHVGSQHRIDVGGQRRLLGDHALPRGGDQGQRRFGPAFGGGQVRVILHVGGEVDLLRHPEIIHRLTVPVVRPAVLQVVEIVEVCGVACDHPAIS